MNKDFKALEKEAHEYASLPNDDNIYHELKTGFKDGWNACYTYLQKGKDVASDNNSLKVPCDAPLGSSNSIEHVARNIVNQLFDIAEVPIKKRQEINDVCDVFVIKIINGLKLKQ